MFNKKWFDHEECGDIVINSKHSKKYGYDIINELVCKVLYDNEDNEYIVVCEQLGDWGQEVSENLAIDDLLENCFSFIKSMESSDTRFISPQTIELLNKYKSIFIKVENGMERRD